MRDDKPLDSDRAPLDEQLVRVFRPVLEREVFVLGGARGALPRWPLDDFFDGLEAAGIQSHG